MTRMRALRADLSKLDSAARFQSLGVDVFQGSARFTGRDSVEVAGATLRFARAAIATGGRATAPPIPGLAEAGYLTNETVFSLTQMPRRLTVIGAGPDWMRNGAGVSAVSAPEVTLLEVKCRKSLTREDRDAARLIESALIR